MQDNNDDKSDQQVSEKTEEGIIPLEKKRRLEKNTPKGANATTKRTEAEAEEEIFYRNNMPRLDAAAVQNSKVSYFLMWEVPVVITHNN